MFFSRVVSAAALIGTATATFQILAPGGPDVWWVADSQNTMVWTCHIDAPAVTYQLLIANGDPTILPAPQAIIANVANADCSHTITTQQAALTPAQNYTLILADNLDQTKQYAVSQPFEVKAAGSSFPASSATPTESLASSTASGTGSAASTTGTSSSSSSSSSSSGSNGAAGLQISLAGFVAVAGAAFGMF
ncbi:hypothetical protein OF83DRAFT_1221702 [Amylostereum chailletii]|nr:hypothetical protein OF83DRAFT_1221702 [Amylostereum chailletii]